MRNTKALGAVVDKGLVCVFGTDMINKVFKGSIF